jgi:hypothetical protein
LAIQQDSAVVPCWVASSNNLAEVWVRPLGGITANTPIYGTVRPPLPMTTSNAVLIINESTTNQTTTVTAAMLGQPASAPITIRDPWNHTTVSNFTGSFSWTVGPTNMVLLTTFPAAFTGNNGVFTGDGSGLTNLSASMLTSGTIPAARMPALQAAYPNALTNHQTGSTIVSNLTAESFTNRAVGATRVVVTDVSGKEVGATLSGITLIGTTLTASAGGFTGDSTQFGVSGSVTNIKRAALVTNLVNSGVIPLVESGGAFASDASLGTCFRGTLTGNDTLANPTNPRDGLRVTWELIQDGVGNRKITMDTKFAFGTDITGITLSKVASKRDFITAMYDSAADKWFVIGFVRGY